MLETLKKYRWAFTLAVIAFMSFMSARKTNQMIAEKLAPPEKVEGLPPPRSGPEVASKPPSEPPAAPGDPASSPPPAPPSDLPTVEGDAGETVATGVEVEGDLTVPEIPSKMNYEVILVRNIFDSENSLQWPENVVSGADGVDQGPTVEPLDLRLFGTVVAYPSRFSWAILSRNTNGAINEIFKLGDDLYNMGRLTEVNRREILVTRPDGVVVSVKLYTGEETAPPTAVTGKDAPKDGEPPLGDSVKKIGENKYEIDGREVQAAIENVDKLSQSARIVPSFESGNPAGFKIFRIKQDSLYNKLGLRNGDVIQKINGTEINSTEKALQLYQTLRTEKNISIDVTRRGQRMTLEYVIR